jgi:Chitinase class I
MTSQPKSSASSTRVLFVAGTALAAYLFVSFTGCSDTSSGTSRTGGDTSGGGGSGQGSGTTTSGSPSGTTSGGNPSGTTTGSPSGTTTGTPTGGTPTTTGGSGGSTGAAGGGAGGGNVSGCTTGVAYPAGNRCGGVAQPTVAAGGQLLIDDLEMVAGDTATCHNILAVDGRTGSWNSGKDPVSPMGVVTHSFDPPGAGAPAVLGSRAVHIVGSGLNSWGGYLAVPFAACYNASRYSGLSFWFKGDPAQAPWMKLSIVTPRTAEAAEGGTCVQGVGAGNECYDHFSVNLFKVSNVWTRYTITWQQLAQYGWGQKVPVTYRPETEIIGINFAPDWGSDAADKVFNKKFEFWVDYLSFDVAGPFTDTGFKQIVTQAQFNGAYAGRNMSFFGDPYTQLAAALEDPRFSRIGREGSTDDRKREIAALMAHIWQETGGLQFVTEVSPPSDYCRAMDPLYPCVAGQTYIGRGPLQLSWNYNYGQAGEYLGVPTLLSNPGQVATDPSLSWRGSMFFWMAWRDKDTNSLLVGPHYRFLHDGFGASIRAVNGALECAPTGTAAGLAAAEHRKQLYMQYCSLLGVTPDPNLICPAT